jgi:putative MFS transporter
MIDGFKTLGISGQARICIGGTQVLLFVYPTELFPTAIRASALGVGTSFSKLGAAIGIYLVPMSVASFGISPTMYAAAAISLVGLAATVILAPETRPQKLMRTA